MCKTLSERSQHISNAHQMNARNMRSKHTTHLQNGNPHFNIILRHAIYMKGSEAQEKPHTARLQLATIQQLTYDCGSTHANESPQKGRQGFLDQRRSQSGSPALSALKLRLLRGQVYNNGAYACLALLRNSKSSRISLRIGWHHWPAEDTTVQACGAIDAVHV